LREHSLDRPQRKSITTDNQLFSIDSSKKKLELIDDTIMGGEDASHQLSKNEGQT
jgi:hypothetical protein